MAIFHSIPGLVCLVGASVLTWWGARSKQGGLLSFLGVLLGSAAVVCALIGGASLHEALLWLLVLLLLSMPSKRYKKREGQP